MFKHKKTHKLPENHQQFQLVDQMNFQKLSSCQDFSNQVSYEFHSRS